jgi:hypothetical protein
MSSLAWFDCVSLSTFIAWFLGLFGPNYTSLSHFAFAFPLLMHTLSMYTMVFSCLILVPLFLEHCARCLNILCGFVNIQKHSDKSSLLVKDGSKIIAPFVSLALIFYYFLLLISDRLSCHSLGFRGFIFGRVAWILVRASSVQSWE